MSPTSVSPNLCLKCGHQFAPGAPEPSWCPGCGELCSAFDVPDEPPDPDEIPETPQDQRRLRGWFWVLFLSGPVVAGLAFLFGGTSLMPAGMRPFAPAGAEPLLALLAAAGGAGFCLARIKWPRRSLGAQLVLGVAMGGALLFAYLGMAVVVCALYYILVKKIGK